MARYSASAGREKAAAGVTARLLAATIILFMTKHRIYWFGQGTVCLRIRDI